MEYHDRPQYNATPISEINRVIDEKKAREQKVFNGVIVGSVVGTLMLIASGVIDLRHERENPSKPSEIDQAQPQMSMDKTP